MNNFIKHAASGVHKPSKKLTEKNKDITLKECIISFNFEDFYYSNENLFKKNTNTLEDVTKSLLIMESFKYEKQIIIDIITILKKISYITDIYFLPIGWLVGINDSIIQDKHFIIKILFTISNNVLENKISDFLNSKNIYDVTIDFTKECYVNSFPTPHTLPSVIISFYPFDTSYILIVLFFGVYNDSYCGISYISKRDNLNYIIDVLKPMVREITIISDEITRLVSIKLFDTSNGKIFPEKNIYSICEIVNTFDKSKFGDISIKSNISIIPFINKKIISIIDLPSNVEIKCFSKDSIDFITHIDNKRLSTVLIIAKDKFMNNITFSGTFKKENIIWKGKYTYRILESTFDAPTLRVSKGDRVCKKNTFDKSTFTSRIGTYII
ncbi:telomere binding protein [Cotia virus SPAn232]|uniref:Telomere binding protein n=2 Tax=Cotia virus TaxID=39444 RepID=H6TA39_9POXV|nr:telomere binding protein [Cotia virus SPAn232]ADT91079.1 telomere binding protein [Cotia virus SPAn232]AIT70678.1 telomere binding protein [Cotia virus]